MQESGNISYNVKSLEATIGGCYYSKYHLECAWKEIQEGKFAAACGADDVLKTAVWTLNAEPGTAAARITAR